LRGALVDVSEWRRTDRRLRQAQRLEVIGRLTGGVAHDFNNVLTAVRLYSELLLDALRGDAPPQADALQRDVEEIRRAADRASALTRQLLSFSRVDAPDAQPLDVGAAVAALTPMLRRLISARVALEVERPNVTAVTVADPGQLEQIVLNLCVNARDAMPNGGTLTVTTRAAMVRDDRQWVTLAVRDTGTGMDAATLARAFEPFFTTKAAGEGTGLGLATVAEIVQESGGYVELDSTVGEGTTVTIWLRQLEGLAAESRDPLRVPNVVTPLAQHGTILLVEDEPAVRAGLRRVLVRHGYAVLEAGNGAEALAISDAYDGRIHLVLTDLVMPEMGGAELAELLAVRRPDTPVVFVSGYASDVAVVGENAFVPKPVSSADVLRVVHAALATVGA
jgi:two-component system cell cycle sensor histidine kinase/response regulator CckA